MSALKLSGKYLKKDHNDSLSLWLFRIHNLCWSHIKMSGKDS